MRPVPGAVPFVLLAGLGKSAAQPEMPLLHVQLEEVRRAILALEGADRRVGITAGIG